MRSEYFKNKSRMLFAFFTLLMFALMVSMVGEIAGAWAAIQAVAAN